MCARICEYVYAFTHMAAHAYYRNVVVTGRLNGHNDDCTPNDLHSEFSGYPHLPTLCKYPVCCGACGGGGVHVPSFMRG